MRRFAIKTLILSILAVFLFSAAAQEQGLYAPAPPPDAAFVRVFNASSGDLSLTLGAVGYDALLQGTASPYEVVLQGSQALSAGSVTSTLELSAGRFYTVLLTDTATLLEDPSLANRAKTLLLLYNLSNDPVTLETADGTTEVIPEVASGSSDSTEVNPISVTLGVFAGDAVLEAFPEVQLERGAVYSTFVLPDGAATFTQNTTATD